MMLAWMGRGHVKSGRRRRGIHDFSIIDERDWRWCNGSDKFKCTSSIIYHTRMIRTLRYHTAAK